MSRESIRLPEIQYPMFLMTSFLRVTNKGAQQCESSCDLSMPYFPFPKSPESYLKNGIVKKQINTDCKLRFDAYDLLIQEKIRCFDFNSMYNFDIGSKIMREF